MDWITDQVAIGNYRDAALALISAKREIYLSEGIDEVLGP